MRILHVITTLERGGAENHLVQLVRGQIAEGLSVSILYLKGRDELVAALSELGAHVKKWNYRPRTATFRARDFDIVHAHLPHAEVLARLMTWRTRNLVISRHLAGKFFTNAPVAMSRLLSRFVESGSRRVICISKAVRDYMEASRHCVKLHDLRVVHYGYTPAHPPQDMFNERDTPNPDQSKVTISCIARLVPQKDLPTLVRAIYLLQSRGIFASVKIAGTGPDLEDLKRLCADLNVDQQIEFVGRIKRPEKFITESDIFVLPSLFEGFGLVLLEAAAAGVPAIAARNTAMAEVIVDRETGLLFSTGDEEDLATKIEELANDLALRQNLAKGASVRLATTFSVHHMVKETSAIYEEVVREREVGAR